jgi:hypothetical protein
VVSLGVLEGAETNDLAWPHHRGLLTLSTDSLGAGN